MKNLLRELGIVLDIKTNDEAYIMLHAINLLENRLGASRPTADKPNQSPDMNR
jgi:hypothetical protein